MAVEDQVIDSMFQIDPNREPIVEDRKVKCYTVKGKEDYLDPDNYPITNIESDIRTHAKLVTIGNTRRYYVKRSKTGRLFNPLGLFDENQQLKQMRHASKPQWEMKMTNQKVFSNYIEFLKTRNEAYLRNAEREEL